MNHHSRVLTGDRSERYELPIDARRPIYIRPGWHPDPGHVRRPIGEVVMIATAWLLPTIIGWSIIALVAHWIWDALFWQVH